MCRSVFSFSCPIKDDLCALTVLYVYVFEEWMNRAHIDQNHNIINYYLLCTSHFMFQLSEVQISSPKGEIAVSCSLKDLGEFKWRLQRNLSLNHFTHKKSNKSITRIQKKCNRTARPTLFVILWFIHRITFCCSQEQMRHYIGPNCPPQIGIAVRLCVCILTI